MQQNTSRQAVGWTAAVAAMALVAAPAAMSQTSVQSQTTPTSQSAKISTSMTVESVDAASRHIKVKLPSGETEVLKVSPAVQRLGDLKPGDKIKATYYAEVAYAIAEPGKPLPENANSVFAARAAKEDLPAGLAASRATVTGNVLAINTATSKVKVVNAQGGEVHELDVTTPEGKAFLAKLKVGDKVTANVREALLISVDRE